MSIIFKIEFRNSSNYKFVFLFIRLDWKWLCSRYYICLWCFFNWHNYKTFREKDCNIFKWKFYKSKFLFEKAYICYLTSNYFLNRILLKFEHVKNLLLMCAMWQCALLLSNSAQSNQTAPNLTKHHWSSRWRSQLERTPRYQKVGCSNPSRYRPNSFYKILQRVLRVEQYKRRARVTVVVAS